MAKRYLLSKQDARDFNRLRRLSKRAPTPRPRRMPRRRHSGGGGGGTVDVTGTTASAWTVGEYEPVSGAIIRTFYRGISRTQTPSADYDVIMTSSGNLFANGSTDINQDNGIGVLYDAATGDVLWSLNRNGMTAVTSLASTYASGSLVSKLTSHHVIESADGYLWIAGAGSVMRVNASTGVATHRIAVLSGAISFLLPCSTSGSIVMRPGSSSDGDRISVINSSGSRTHGFSTITPIDVDEGAGVLAAASGTTLTTLNSSDLSTIATGAVGGSDVRAVCTDGTHVWVMCNHTGAKFKKFAVNDITTEIFNVTGLTTTASGVFMKYNPINGYIYATSGTQMRKVDPTTGSVVWTSSAIGSSPLVICRHCCGFGSDFVVVANNSGGSPSIYCLNDSDGSTRWSDFAGGGMLDSNLTANTIYSCGVYVNASDDRIFISHARRRA